MSDNKFELDFEPLTEAINRLNMSIIYNISDYYNLNRDEVISKFSNLQYSYLSNKKDMNKKKERKNKEYPIPWCPEYVDINNKCNAIVSNKGLFTQCQRNINSKDNNQKFCNICKAHPENSYQKYGTITERLNKGIYEYRSPIGTYPEPYLNHIPTDVDESIVKENLKDRGYSNVPEEHFNKPRTIFKNQRNKKPTLDIEAINNSPIICRDNISPIHSPKHSPIHSPIISSPIINHIEEETNIINTKPVKSTKRKTVKAVSAGSC